MVVISCGKHGNDRSRTENVTERTWFYKSRSNDLEDIGQGQRSSHATHLLMLVIICTKYGKNPSRAVDATEQTRFSRSRLNDLENKGRGQKSLHATDPLILVIICAKYGKNPSRTLDLFFQGQGRKFKKNCQKFKFSDSEKKPNTRHTLWCQWWFVPKYGKNASRIVDFFSRWKPKNLKNLRKIDIL